MAAWNRLPLQGRPGMAPDAVGRRYVVHSPTMKAASFVGLGRHSPASPTGGASAPRQSQIAAAAGRSGAPPVRAASAAQILSPPRAAAPQPAPQPRSSPSAARPAVPPQSARAPLGPSPQRTYSGLLSAAERELDLDAVNEVAAFLKEHGLGKHAAAFLQSGVDDMETLLALDERDMQDLGLPIFHRQRLCRRLEELRSKMQPELKATHPVAQFMQGAGLGQYARALIRSGFDEMETLMEIEDSDLKELGMPRGHILKLRKRLREFAAEHEARDCALLKVSENRSISQVATPQRGPDMVLAESTRKLPEGHMKTAVEQSWERVQALGPTVIGEMLYQHTLALAPAAVALFPYEVRVKYLDWSSVDDESDIYNSPGMRRLFARIVKAVGSCVMGLADPMTMVPWLLQLGGRHIGYGAEEEQWQVVLEALHLTLRDALGAAYTPDVEEAWKKMGNFIAYIMIEGLRQAQEAAARKHSDAPAVSRSSSSTTASIEEPEAAA